jgi:Flp pilus assembly pilin Flp
MNLQILRARLIEKKSQRAATMVEYGIMLALILLIAYLAFKQLGETVSKTANDAKSAFGG